MKKIGIIGAMELEVETLKQQMENPSVTTRAGMAFYEGTLSGVNVVVVQCGIGKVNASLCVQILADLFAVTHVINTGIAGSLDPELDIGDILISRDAVHHDVDVQIFGYAPGEVPGIGFREFPANKEMGEKALALCKEETDFKARMGRVVSGDQFISDSAVKERLISVFGGSCAEMEGASIAQGAYLNGLPFLILRAISDKADGSAEMDYPTFERAAALHCAGLVQKLVAEL